MNMVKVKTAEAKGRVLDWMVAKVHGREEFFGHGFGAKFSFHPSSKWVQGGPIIEREGIDVLRDGDHWTALKTMTVDHRHLRFSGPTLLVAAMRCYVASKMGNEVEVPEDLL